MTDSEKLDALYGAVVGTATSPGIAERVRHQGEHLDRLESEVRGLNDRVGTVRSMEDDDRAALAAAVQRLDVFERRCAALHSERDAARRKRVERAWSFAEKIIAPMVVALFLAVFAGWDRIARVALAAWNWVTRAAS